MEAVDSDEDESLRTPLVPRSSTMASVSRRRRMAVGFVLVSLTLERLAYFALAANFFLFLNKGSVGSRDASAWGTAQAMDAVLVFSGVSHLSSFFAGWLADAVTGRFRTILLGFLLYITGYSLLTALSAHALPVCHFPPIVAKNGSSSSSNDSVHDEHDILGVEQRRDMNPCSEVVYPIAVLVGLGVGAIKANMAPFGAEQTVESTTLGTFSNRRSFFMWYYRCVNIGGLLGIGVLCYVQQNVANDGFPLSYLVATCCLGVACLLLIVPGGCCGLYRDVKPSSYSPRGFSSPSSAGFSVSSSGLGGSSTGLAPSTAFSSCSAVTHVFRVIRDAYQNRRTSSAMLCGTPVSDVPDWYEGPGRRSNNSEGSSGSSRRTPPSSLPPALRRPQSFLDWAKVEFGGSFSEDAVEQVKALGPILLVFASLLPHWLVYFQIETTFQAQGLHMKLDIGEMSAIQYPNVGYAVNTSSFQVPAAWLTLFDVVFLLVLIPLLNNLLYPWCERRGVAPSLWTRMGVGMVFGVLAATSAGVLETERRRLWKESNSTHITQVVSGTEYEAVDLSVLWQLPQYSLVGLAEAFASVAGLEYAYSASPRVTQNLIMGLYCAFQGLAAFLALALLSLCRLPLIGWINDDQDDGIVTTRQPGKSLVDEDRFDLYFFALAGIQAVTLVVFLLSVCLCRRQRSSPSSSRGSGSSVGRGMRNGSQTTRYRVADDHSSVST